MEIREDDRITPEKIVETLKKEGVSITIDQAKLILDFLYKMANIAVQQYLVE